ncbi:MAG: hypothetical protein JWP72_2656 [Massilia sp.]|nr:hypothetical protein [Massilia sp.]
MPGAYAHITLVNIAKETERLESAGVPIPAIQALLRHFGFCELGAVSPDYPYLHFGHEESKVWADSMHYVRTGEPIKKGIELARALSGDRQAKVVAWLSGYAAHVVADVTIHPVVELRVGEYATNAKAHRVCELNQDAYIFQRLGLDEVGRSEHLDTGIWSCCDVTNAQNLDQTIADTWRRILSNCHPAMYMENEPDIDGWHAGFKRAVDVAEEGNRMPLLARHLAVNCGLTYPAITDIDHTFIENLITPTGKMHYDELFDRARDNVVKMWAMIGKAIFENDMAYQTGIGNWNLDTGKDDAGKFAYWPNKLSVDHA